MVRLEHVSFRYRAATDPALRDVCCHLRRGEAVGLLGLSGSGRSTLAATLNGTIPRLVRGELTGRVLLGGEDIAGRYPRELADRIGYLFQDFEAQLFSTSVALEVAFGPENLAVPRAQIVRRVAECLELVGLSSQVDRAPAALSGGQKQRLALASVLALEPQVLVLDEPTSDLDPSGRAELLAAIRRLRARADLTVLVIDPQVDELGWADRLLVLDRGQVVLEGTPGQVWSRPAELTARGLKPFTLSRLAASLGCRGPWDAAPEAARAIAAAGWQADPQATGRLQAADAARPAPGDALLEMEDLTYGYADGTQALRGVSLSLRQGEYVALLGRNGSGKTTLVRHLNGILTPAGGDLRLRGRSLRGQSPASLCRSVGLVFQNPDHQIFAERVWDEVAFGPRLQGLSAQEVQRRTEEALAAVGLAGLGQVDPFLLSKGGRQRVAVAAALATQPEIIVLDEPTTGLDSRELEGMTALIGELNAAGHTILIVTHAMDLAACCAHRVVLLEEGRILRDGPTRQVFGDLEALREAGLAPPLACQVGRLLGVPALTVEELVASLTRSAPAGSASAGGRLP
ncbi:MAG: energy-coupling factor transporter ATPase [Candidatus Latescibacterota bacterium]